MAKTSRPTARIAQDEAVRAAIALAEKPAGADDREFMRVLNKSGWSRRSSCKRATFATNCCCGSIA